MTQSKTAIPKQKTGFLYEKNIISYDTSYIIILLIVKYLFFILTIKQASFQIKHHWAKLLPAFFNPVPKR